MKISRALAFGVMALAASSIEASATHVPAQGARGDASFDDRCPPGQYLVGLKIRSGLWIDQLSISCAKFTVAGIPGGLYHGPNRGGNGGGPGEGHCRAGYAIDKLDLRFTTGNRQVVSFDFRCHSIRSTTTHRLFLGSKAYTAPVPFPPTQNCPAGEIAVGLHGNYGKHVNAVGLICEKVAIPPPAKTPTTPGIPPPKQPQKPPVVR